MFKKLKGKFETAQQDLVDGFKALASLETQSKHEKVRNAKSRDINLDVGADLLLNYQQIWSAIQEDTQESAKTAEELSLMLLPLFKSWDIYAEMMNKLEVEVRYIPSIISSLKDSQALLDELRKDFAVAERSMDMLENLCEEIDQKKRFNIEKYKLSQYKTMKLVEAEKIKVDLAHTHAKNMAELESAKLHTLQERAEAFTSAFQEDVDFYKTHGHPDRLPTEFPKVTSLSEIDIDQDQTALDSFLAEETENMAGGLESSGEGAYIEDDYTTEYTIKQDAEYGDIDQVINELKLTVDVADSEDESCEVENGSTVKGREGGKDEEEDEELGQGAEGGEVQSSPGFSSASKDSGIDDTDSLTSKS